MRLEQRPIPVPNDDQVLLKMEVVGICGSDVHYLVHGKIGPFVVEKPMVIGHEASGTVVQVGKNVKGLVPVISEGQHALKLPCNMSLEDGALMEPLAVGVHACKRGNVRVGDVCLVLGAGPIGLVTLLAAKAMGASTIIVTGAQQSVRVALSVTRTGGVCVLVGLGAPDMNLPITGALIREVDIRGVFRYSNEQQILPQAIEMVKTGKIDVRPLITHHYTLEDTLKAFHTAKTQEGNPIKVLIHANPDWKPS
ncbi:hypothetical protein NQ314_006528 [Rhamnusium bicolor]|uniref:Sorbitol dehydrogenase n=1 Tax=Rhamnusium bicolor TaxID=1586634 RepID=A0AAV8Z018_9CUCU|nr:hypothetical protein NQ314_006528 [Rhamnusium bicolor]